MPDHYETLGVRKDASADDIKQAKRRKSRAAHPDRKGGDHTAMVAINRAYETLSDPARRAHYDRTGQDQPPPPLDAKARTIIMQTFLVVMEQASDQHEIIESVRHHIRKNQDEAQTKAAQLRDKAAMYERRRKRLKYSGKDRNFLLDTLEQQIAAMKQSAATMETESKAVGDRALEILKDLSYDPEEIRVMAGGKYYVFNINVG
ncbi:MAG TPA: DnaJ domain-containing protein [Steroidobacteraceae bacterium]